MLQKIKQRKSQQKVSKTKTVSSIDLSGFGITVGQGIMSKVAFVQLFDDRIFCLVV